MLLQKLAELADQLDKKGFATEAEQVDELMKFIEAETQCSCDCSGCKEDKHTQCACDACASDGACGCK